MAELSLPPEMVEAAARAEYACDMTREECDDFEPFTWDEALPSVRTAYLDRARAGLTAALSVCEVERVQGPVANGERRFQGERCTYRWPDGSVLITPWREVPGV